MMISVKGKIQNGVALPLEPVGPADEGRNVIITILEEAPDSSVSRNVIGHTRPLEDLIAECEVDTGITDLASQHDHYLYGKPKK